MKRSDDRKKPTTTAAPQTPRGGFGTLGALLNAAGLAPQTSPEASVSTDEDSRPPPAQGPTTPLHPAFRLERKGHGGKTVTAFDATALSDDERQRLCRRLSAALGCGCRVDGLRILIQGDVALRAERWFEKEYMNV